MRGSRFRSRTFTVVALAATVLFAAAQAALATPGELDGSFDGDGMASYDRGSGNEQGFEIAVGPGNKLFVVGTILSDFFVMRINTGGTVDTDYGDNGFALIDPGSDNDRPEDLVVMSDGSVLVVGQTQIADLAQGFLAKLTPEGDPAPTFGGGDGVFIAKNGSDDVYLSTLVVQPSGRIVVGGETDPTADHSLFYLERAKANGTIDPSFGTGGRAETAFGPGYDGGWKLVQQSDGKLVFGGWTEEGVGTSTYDSMFARFTAGGKIDTSFGANGKSVVSIYDGGDDYVNGLALLPNGKLAACLNFSDGVSANKIAVLRLATNGKLDPSFGGGDGSNILAKPAGDCVDIAAQDDGKLVVAASAGTDDRFAAVRFKSGGRIDPTFGEDGIASADYGTPAIGVEAVTIQPNGRIVLVGGVSNGANSDVAVARFLP